VTFGAYRLLGLLLWFSWVSVSDGRHGNAGLSEKGITRLKNSKYKPAVIPGRPMIRAPLAECVNA
jgi:hypothetical protein